MHPQYSRSTDPNHSRDILIQENHGCEVDEHGNILTLVGSPGADIHIVRDDGTNWRDLPWGRDHIESCQGHQCWRGARPTAITSVFLKPGEERERRGIAPIVEGTGFAGDRAHCGRTRKTSDRREISTEPANATFCHFAFHDDGERMVTDSWFQKQSDRREQVALYAGRLLNGNAPLRLQYILHPRTSFAAGQHTHPHPFLSPDGKKLFFNSDHSGTAQIWMAENFDFE